MTGTTTGSQEPQTQQHETTSKAQPSSSNDAGTPQKARKQTPADKFKQVNDLITGALTPDDVTRVTPSDDDDTSEQRDAQHVLNEDDEGQHGPAGDDRSMSGGGDGDEDATHGPSSSPSARTLYDIAEQMGVKVSELYDIDIPLKDGETVKLGAMKDAFKSKQAADAEYATRAAQLDERETAIVHEQMLWAQLGDELTQKLSPQARDAFQQRMQAQQERERQALMQAVPELRDQTKFDAFRDEVVKTLSRYGFQPQEIVVSDHRQLLVVRDLARAQARLKQLREYQPTQKTPSGVKPNGRGAPGQQTARIVNNARNSKNPSDKARAAAALINGAR